jgi:hypothetical protein
MAMHAALADRVSVEAKQVDVGRLLVTVIAAVLWSVGWTAAKVVTAFARAVGWSVAAIRVGWREGRQPQPARRS